MQSASGINTNNKFIAKVAGIGQKAKAFDKKHNLIVNSIVLVCAIIILFVALFAPIKVVTYEYAYTKTDGGETTIEYIEVNQSIFQVMGALSYIGASDEKKAEISKQSKEAVKKAQEEFVKKYPSRKMTGPQTEEERNEYDELLADYMSDVNVLGSILAFNNLDDIKNADPGLFIDAIVTAVMGVIIGIVAIVMAIISVINIVFAIMNIVQKKPQAKQFKYLGWMVALSAFGITGMMASPMMVAGGGMFAVALFACIMLLIMGVGAGLLAGKLHWMVILKRSIIMLFSIIAFFVLCNNVFAVISEAAKSTKLTATGYGFHRVVNVYGQIMKSESDENMIKDLMSELGSYLIGIILYTIVAGMLVAWASKMLRRSIKMLVEPETKRSINSKAVVTAIVALLAIIVGFMSKTIAEKLVGIFSEQVGMGSATVSTKWLMRAPIWVTLIFSVGVVVVNKVFLPDDTVKAKKVAEPVQAQPVEAMQQPIVAQDNNDTVNN